MSQVKAYDLETTPIPQGLVIWWPGTGATIPGGFELASGGASANDPTFTKPTLTDAFPKGDSDGVMGTGGSTSHVHSVPSHNHGGLSGPEIGDQQSMDSGSDTGVIPTHEHPIDANSDALDTQSHLPRYKEAIPIVYTMPSAGTGHGLPRLHDLGEDALPPWAMIGLWPYTTAIPAGWGECDGATVNGVVKPNLRGKFIRGIATTATTPADIGGSTTHTHDAAHQHTMASYTASYGAIGDYLQFACTVGTHHHDIPSQSLTTDAGSSEPPYREAKFIAFTGYGASAPAHALGVIKAADLDPVCRMARGAMVAFNKTALPTNWQHADGGAWVNGAPTGQGATRIDMRGFHLRHSTGASSGVTGGADQHTHTVVYHHTHASYAVSNSAWLHLVHGGGPSDANIAANNHTHGTGADTWTGNLSAYNAPPTVTLAFAVRD